MMNQIEMDQRATCEKFSANFVSSPSHLKVGISLNVKDGIYPVNGLRIEPEGDTCGWYIWAGEWSDDPNFFVPVHVAHLPDWSPLISKYLGLPPGWRFLVASGYEDVWEDKQLLDKPN